MPPLSTHGEDPRTAGANRRRRQASTGQSAEAQERGARVCRFARPNHRGPYHTPTLPTLLPHISAGGQGFEEWEAGEVGGRNKGSEATVGVALGSRVRGIMSKWK